MLFNLQFKKATKKVKNILEVLGLVIWITFQSQGMGQKQVPKPRDFRLVVTMAETGWGTRFPFLA